MTDNNGFEWTAEIENNSENTVLIPTNDSSVLANTLNSLILDGDFQAVKDFLKEKAFTGRNIPIINACISQLLKSEKFHYINFWAFVRVLVMHNASLFLATISKSISHDKSIPPCEPATLDDIIKSAFMAIDKLHHAINLISIVSKQLTFEQKEFILNSCLNTKNPETLSQAFKMLDMPPAFVISYLRNKLDNPVVLYTLYDYYHIANINKEISNNTLIEVFSIPYINILINDLKNKGGKCRDVAYLIEYDLRIVNQCKNKKLYRDVCEFGHKGYNTYYATIRGKERIKENISNLIFKDKNYNFKVIGKLKNYHVLLHTTTGLRTLLPIDLSVNVPEDQVQAFIYKHDKKNGVLYASQIKVPKHYVEPCLLDIGSKVVISFSLYNGVLYPHLRRLTGLFSVKVSNMHIVDDFRAKYRAKVKKKIGDFRYLVEIIDNIS
jgi:hypothetical protein